MACLQKRFHLSRSALYRLFAEEGGVLRYIRAQRLDHGHRLLVQPLQQLNISEIAHLLHFSTGSRFGRHFRVRFGMSPKEARHQGVVTRRTHSSRKESDQPLAMDWIAEV